MLGIDFSEDLVDSLFINLIITSHTLTTDDTLYLRLGGACCTILYGTIIAGLTIISQLVPNLTL